MDSLKTRWILREYTKNVPTCTVTEKNPNEQTGNDLFWCKLKKMESLIKELFNTGWSDCKYHYNNIISY